MRIKRLVAMALAGTMVFSIVACSDAKKKESSNATTNNETTKDEEGNNGTSNVPVEDVIEAYKMYMQNDGKNYTYNTTMSTKIQTGGLSIYIEQYLETKSYDNVTYIKTTSKTNLTGTDNVYVEESLRIEKEDGSEVVASKTEDDENWSVGVITTSKLDLFEALKEQELNVDELKKSAKMESKGDECYVTIKLETGEMETNGETGSFEADVKITYNTKQNAIIGIDVGFDLESINEFYSSMVDMVYDELVVKIDSIKKTDKPIDIPDEIEID